MYLTTYPASEPREMDFFIGRFADKVNGLTAPELAPIKDLKLSNFFTCGLFTSVAPTGLRYFLSAPLM